MAKSYVRDHVPLSRFGVLVAQLESIVASAAHTPPDALLCFDLLSDLVSAKDEEPKESILLWQRKCEDALCSLLVLGARRPVLCLASVAMARINMMSLLRPICSGGSASSSEYTEAFRIIMRLAAGDKSFLVRIAAARCLKAFANIGGSGLGVAEFDNSVSYCVKVM
ncbi:HEAT repeat-containing protein [Actinidia rufa]|uniref:HEAT repeat-containing protein n=1 Tax=Actinidia rufa TaxID=165716 RepID=A0A7J0EKI4_9ERIC|nr:HEAT repeat-containing protein [Actinidia rufa]